MKIVKFKERTFALYKDLLNGKEIKTEDFEKYGFDDRHHFNSQIIRISKKAIEIKKRREYKNVENPRCGHVVYFYDGGKVMAKVEKVNEKKEEIKRKLLSGKRVKRSKYWTAAIYMLKKNDGYDIRVSNDHYYLASEKIEPPENKIIAYAKINGGLLIPIVDINGHNFYVKKNGNITDNINAACISYSY